MRIYNTMSGRKEEFKPIEEGKIRMYVCGPTVYNLIHIGNARPMIVFDTFRRYMEYRGYHFHYVSNYTDVDDKIIQRANEGLAKADGDVCGSVTLLLPSPYEVFGVGSPCALGCDELALCGMRILGVHCFSLCCEHRQCPSGVSSKSQP